MKTTELMIGNWVYCRESSCQGHRVDFVNEMDGEVGVDGEILDLDMVFPIPLTPEILEKNGFEEVKHYYPYPTYEFRGIEQCVVRVAFPKDSNKTKREKPFMEIDSERYWISVDTEYVHELQNVLTLCKIEKEIEL